MTKIQQSEKKCGWNKFFLMHEYVCTRKQTWKETREYELNYVRMWRKRNTEIHHQAFLFMLQKDKRNCFAVISILFEMRVREKKKKMRQRNNIYICVFCSRAYHIYDNMKYRGLASTTRQQYKNAIFNIPLLEREMNFISIILNARTIQTVFHCISLTVALTFLQMSRDRKKREQCLRYVIIF